jgi:hypothetical protein
MGVRDFVTVLVGVVEGVEEIVVEELDVGVLEAVGVMLVVGLDVGVLEVVGVMLVVGLDGRLTEGDIEFVRVGVTDSDGGMAIVPVK